MLPLGTPAPAISLPDFAGQRHELAEFASAPALLVAFICRHCPFVQHIRPAFAAFTAEFGPRGLAVVAINSNDLAAHHEDGPEGMRAEAAESGYAFPYLLDESQEVAKAYRAACTPDFYLFDARRRLVYRGQFDDSRPGNGRPVTGADLRAATLATLAGRTPTVEQQPSLGCNIKWRRGNEPDYYAG
jgi:peroxiredoxin